MLQVFNVNEPVVLCPIEIKQLGCSILQDLANLERSFPGRPPLSFLQGRREEAPGPLAATKKLLSPFAIRHTVPVQPLDFIGYLSHHNSQTPSPTFPPSQVRFISPRNRSSTIVAPRMAHSAQNSSVVQQQRVIVPNKHGEKLVGLLHDTGSKEIVVLCHGFRSNKDQETMKNLAAALENEGISAFRFDFAGNGESEGSFAYGNYWREVDDLRAVIEHFSGANRVISAILGHSKGGDVVLLYASKYHDISAVVNVSGRYDLNRGIEERLGKDFMEKIKQDGFFDVKNKTGSVIYRVTLESLMDRLNTDMHKACLLIDKECRVFTVHGSADEVIPVEDAFEFAKIIPNHKLQIIEGANHSYTAHQAELASAVLNFIKETLKRDNGTSS